jgi:ArsR family transcriptional regulator
VLIDGMANQSMRAGMTREALEMIAARFRLLGEASRLKLILGLEDGEKNVSALVAATGLAQANVSRQLQTLTDAGILGRRKEGLNVIYQIADKSIFDICDHVCGSLQRRIEGQAGALLSLSVKKSIPGETRPLEPSRN